MVRTHSERGSEVLEAAIVLPMLIVLAFCLIQVCLIAYEGTAMSAAIDSTAASMAGQRWGADEGIDANGSVASQSISAKITLARQPQG